jgi:hypothetical protein
MENLKTKNRVTSTLLTKLLKNESLLTLQDPKACHCGEVFSTSEGLKEHKRAKHDIPAQSALTQLFSQANLAY